MMIPVKNGFFAYFFMLLGLSVNEAKSMGSQYPAGRELLAQFSNSCELGGWTQSALGNTSQLRVLFERLKNDQEACGKDMESAIANLSILEAQVQSLQQSEAALQERSAEEATNDLMLELQSSSSVEVSAALVSAYASERANLSRARGLLSTYDQFGRYHLERGSTALARSLNDLINRRSSLTTCLSKYPGEAYLMATHLASLAGNFVPGLVGTGIQTLALVTATSIKTIQSMPYGKALRNLDQTEAPVAFGCAMRSLAKQFCQMRDAEKLMDLSRNLEPGDPMPSEFFAGLDLLEKRLPALNMWIENLIRGIVPRNPNHAGQIGSYFDRLNRAISMDRNYRSYFQKAADDLRNASDREDRQLSLLRELMSDLIQKVFLNDYHDGRINDNNPLRTFTPLSLAQTLAKSNIEPASDENLLDYIKKIIVLDGQIKEPTELLKFLETNTRNMFEPLYQAARDEYSRNIAANEGALVRSATEISLDQTNAKDAIQFALNFLNNYQFECNDSSCNLINRSQDQFIIDEMRGVLQSIYNQLDRPDATSNLPGLDGVIPSQEVISKVYSLLKLDKQNTYLPPTLEGLVRRDLSARVLSGKLPQEIQDIALVAGQDLQTMLLQNGHTEDQLISDLQSARTVLYGGLETFHKFFEPAIRKAIERSAREAANHQEDSFEVIEQKFDQWIEDLNRDPKTPRPKLKKDFRSTQAQLCILVRGTSGRLPKGLDPKLCQGSIEVNWQAKAKVKWNDVGLSGVDQGYCVYEDFKRLDRINEILSRKSPFN